MWNILNKAAFHLLEQALLLIFYADPFYNILCNFCLIVLLIRYEILLSFTIPLYISVSVGCPSTTLVYFKSYYLH